LFVLQILASAGFCHLVENSGDPWRNFENAHDPYLSYGECIYYMFVTMSTVRFVLIFKLFCECLGIFFHSFKPWDYRLNNYVIN